MILCGKLNGVITNWKEVENMKNRTYKLAVQLITVVVTFLILATVGFVAFGVGTPEEPITTFIDEPDKTTDGYYTYFIYNGSAIITGSDSTIGGEITIPATLGGCPVTEIRYGAFRDRTGLTSVIIPNGVTVIENYAFEGCTNLKNVTIPDSVTNMGKDILNKTEWYRLQPIGDVYIGKVYYKYKGKMPENTYVSILEGTKGIARSAFEDCTNLLSITIPKSIVYIGNGAFEDCTGLTKINWNAENVTALEYRNYIFSNAGTASEGIDVVFGDDVRSIPSCLFSGGWVGYYIYPNIRSIKIGAGVESIGYDAFVNCDKITELIVSKNNPVYHSEGDCIVETDSKKLYLGCKNSVIPLNGSVTRIGYKAFAGCSGLKNVSIPGSVTIIEDYAFQGCIGLESLEIPNSVTSIGCRTFSGCTSITDIFIPDSVTSIESSAFQDCIGLKNAVLSDSILSIEDSVFSGCTGLASITIPDGVTSIGSSAFSGCTGLTSITIPDSVTSIDDYAFYCCTGLTSVTIPDSVKSISGSSFDNTAYYNDSDNWENNVLYIGNHLIKAEDLNAGAYEIKNGTKTIADYAFSGCKSFTSITIPNSVTNIGYSVFRNCTGLTSITIPNSVMSIGWYAFEDCTGLTSITIPDSVTSVGNHAFEGCTGLTELTVSPENRIYHSKNNCIVKTATKELVFGCKNSIIPSDGSVTSICDEAFKNCKNLTSITIPDSVTSIGEYAFGNCVGLANIAIPDGVISIGYAAFSGCTGLTGITISDCVTKIGESAFFGTAYYNNSGNWENDVLYIGNHLIKANNSISGEYEIRKGTKTVADYAFSGCKNFTSITIPNSVTSIGSRAFYDCYGLTSITIPNSVTSIRSDAFSNTAYYNNSSNWKNDVLYIGNHLIKAKDSISGSYEIKNGTKSIADEAFDYCGSLIGIMMPNSVTSIGDSAFSVCTGLTSITIPDSVKFIGESAFIECTELKNIYIPKSVEQIGKISLALCGKLESITVSKENKKYCDTGNCLIDIKNKTLIAGCNNSKIPTDGSVEKIAWYAFFSYSELADIVIPNTVSSIGEAAFADTGMKKVTIPKSVKVIGEYALGYDLTGEKLKDFKIYGYAGTAAEDYAIINNFEFINLDDHTHEYSEKVITTPTCSKNGEKEYKCDCGDSYKEAIPALGHDLVTDVAAKNPTCTEVGNTKGEHCTCCSYLIKSEVIPEIGHVEKIIPAKNATCTDPGYTEGVVCVACGTFIKKIEMIPALGHDMVTDTGMKVPTCTEAGRTESSHCTRCDYKVESVEIGAKGHSEEIIAGKRATCLEPGYTEGIICVVCGKIITEQKEVPSLGHHMTKYAEIKYPTCTESGTTEIDICTRCDYRVGGTTIPPLGHIEEIIKGKSATCTESGLTDGKKCSVCGIILVPQKVTEKAGHSYESVVITPTCTADGYTTHTCSVCGESYTDSIVKALSHTDSDNDGKCDRCGESLGTTPEEPENPSENCSCACHKKGIVKFFFKIGLFFQKIFKKNKICKCGVWHY